MRPVRVLLVDDDPLVRAGLRLLLRGETTLEVVGEASDGAEVPAAVASLRPDVVLMDLRMPRVDGVSATIQLRRSGSDAGVLVLTTVEADAEVVAALRAGAAGYLLKDTPATDIARAVEAVHRGEPVLSPAALRHLVALVAVPSSGERARAMLQRLTPRELEVARLVARGLQNADIGRELALSTATVKAYVSRVLQALEAENRVQVALLVHDAG